LAPSKWNFLLDSSLETSKKIPSLRCILKKNNDKMNRSLFHPQHGG
jgi:hypothetical protein